MSHKRKGQLAMAQDWAKHLRKYGRHLFWEENVRQKRKRRKCKVQK